MIRHIKKSQYKVMPWKNGKGTTTQLWCVPDVLNYDWRISRATVGVDGPFSHFPGYDRSLSIINGNGIKLSVGSGNFTVLTEESNPFEFSGDDDTTSQLVNGPVLDFNVICRRERIRKRVSRVLMDDDDQLFASLGSDAQLFLYSYKGSMMLTTDSDSVETIEGDSYLIEKCNGLVKLKCHSKGAVFLVQLWNT